MIQKKENRGGKREGSGRKPGNLSDIEVGKVVKAFRKMAKDTGRCVGQVLAEIAYRAEDDRVRLKAIEIYFGVTVTRKSHQTVEQKQGPVIMLPAVKGKPEDIIRLEEREKLEPRVVN